MNIRIWLIKILVPLTRWLFKNNRMKTAQLEKVLDDYRRRGVRF